MKLNKFPNKDENYHMHPSNCPHRNFNRCKYQWGTIL